MNKLDQTMHFLNDSQINLSKYFCKTYYILFSRDNRSGGSKSI